MKKGASCRKDDFALPVTLYESASQLVSYNIFS